MGTGGGDLHIYAFHQENGLILSRYLYLFLSRLQGKYLMLVSWKLRRGLGGDPLTS